MAVLVLGLALLLALATHSDATYCLCNTGGNESALQKNIDYACGNGADCSAILQNGACYNPNTVRDHCNYAVNSYYQRRGQAPLSCDFGGTAAVSQNPPSSTGSGCVYQSSPSSGGNTGTPTGGGTTPAGGSTTNPGMTPGSMVPPGSTGANGINTLGPSGSGFGTDNSAAMSLSLDSSSMLIMSYLMVLLLSGLVVC